MGFIISIPLGILLGYFAYKIHLKNQLLGYLFAITPYSIFFWLSLEDREVWGRYRAVAFLATAISSLYCFVKRKVDEKKTRNSDS